MKKSILFSFLFCLLFSCQKEDLTSSILNETVNSTRAIQASDINPVDQLVGIPLHINMPARVGRTFFSVHGGASAYYYIIIHTEDEGSGRQKWVIEKAPGNEGAYYLKITGGYRNNCDYLSFSVSDFNKNKNVPYAKPLIYPAEPVYYKWLIKNIANTNFYTIQQFDRAMKGTTAQSYLTAQSNLIEVILDTYKNNGYQNWELNPIESFEIINMTYVKSLSDYVIKKPSFTTSATVINNTSVTQSMNFVFQEKASESSSYSKTTGVSVSVTAGGKVGLPIVAEGTLSTTATSTKSWTYGKSESQEDSRNYSFPVVAPPYSTVKANATVQIYDISATYIITLRGISSGKEIQLTGTWKGIKAGEITYELTDPNTGVKLKTISGVPTQPITVK